MSAINNDLDTQQSMKSVDYLLDQTKFIQQLMDNKLLTIRAAENVIRILPPLNVKKSEINFALKIIRKVCKNYKI